MGDKTNPTRFSRKPEYKYKKYMNEYDRPTGKINISSFLLNYVTQSERHQNINVFV